MAFRLNAACAGAAILGASVALMASALPASAEVKVQPHKDANQEGLEVFLEGRGTPADANLLGLIITDNGRKTTIRSYCVELPTRLDHGVPLHEVPWDQHPNPNTKFKQNSAKVNWILHHTYPLLKVEEVGKAVGKGISEKEAIAATQAAIWHFTDGADLNKRKPTKVGSSNEDVVAVYEYLIDEKINTGIDQQPAPTLTLEPRKLEGTAGKLIGPFVITTTAETVVLTADLPEGVTLTDTDGNELAGPENGKYTAKDAGDKTAEVFVKVEPDVKAGEMAFSVEANAELAQGRLFVSDDIHKKTQSLIIASPTKVDVKVGAVAKWEAAAVTTPPPTMITTTTTSEMPTTISEVPTTTTAPAPVPGGGNDDELASTGASTFMPLVVGVVLIGAGAGVLLLMRRRRLTT